MTQAKQERKELVLTFNDHKKTYLNQEAELIHEIQLQKTNIAHLEEKLSSTLRGIQV